MSYFGFKKKTLKILQHDSKGMMMVMVMAGMHRPLNETTQKVHEAPSAYSLGPQLLAPWPVLKGEDVRTRKSWCPGPRTVTS